MAKPQVLLTGFPDETYLEAEYQLGFWAGLGFTHYGLRFINVGTGKKNVITLVGSEVTDLRKLHDKYDMRVSALATPIGKVPSDKMPGEVDRVKKAIELCKAFDCRSIRVFSGYPPMNDDPDKHVEGAALWIQQWADEAGAQGIHLGLEVEAKLVGRNGRLQLSLHQAINRPNVSLTHDGANIGVQGYQPADVAADYLLTHEHVGEIHVKDFRLPAGWPRKDDVDENALTTFVPVGQGDSAYPEVFQQLKADLLEGKCDPSVRGLPAFPLALEPHLSKGGQFGGATSPAAMGVAVRTLTKMLDEIGFSYELRSTY